MKFRTILLGLAALFVAFNAAYFSVTGLSKLFAGASFAVILMASSLEGAKLIAASFLHNYWDKLKWTLRLYLTLAITVLIIITSAGIYGFLTSAYQITADQLTVLDKQVEIIDLKKTRYQDQLDGYTIERSELSTSISDLSKGLSTNTIQYRDKKSGEIITTTSSSTRVTLERQLNDMKSQRDIVSKKIESLSDSVTVLEIKILDLQSNNEVAAEVGPLKYMAEITGKEMNTIVNWFALLIIFVFDPLAVTLIIAFNRALQIDRGEVDKVNVSKRLLYGETPDVINDTPIIEEAPESISDEELEYQPPEVPPVIESPHVEDTKIIWSPDKEAEDRRKFSEMKARAVYETDGWKNSYEGKPYYEHPWFDWNKKERWINNQKAVTYWTKNIKSKYPTDFTSKTY